MRDYYLETPGNVTLMSRLAVIFKVLLVLKGNSSKTEIKLFLLCAISHENKSYSQIFCKLLYLETCF